MWQLYPWLPYVCVCACVFACALTAIIDVSRDVDSRVVVISQTFKWWVLFKVWPYPIFSSLCLVCIQLNKTTKKENKKKGTVGLKHHMIVSILWRISDFTSSSTLWCDDVSASLFYQPPNSQQNIALSSMFLMISFLLFIFTQEE